MDLVSIAHIIWRHKVATVAAIVVTLLGAAYVFAIKAPVYQASSTLLFLNPHGLPSKAQVAKNPSLGSENASNPYGSLGGLWTADAVVSAVSGTIPGAQVVLSTNINAPPIINVTGDGASPEAAIRTTNLAIEQVMATLYQLQEQQGVYPYFMIKAVELVRPDHAQASLSAKLRSLIAILAAGTILLFVVLSAAQAIGGGSVKRRRGVATTPVKPAEPYWDGAFVPGSDSSRSRWRSDIWPAPPTRRADNGTADSATAQSDGRSPDGPVE